MKKSRYNAIVNEVIETINRGVILMTEREEYNYKKKVIKDLQVWLKAFPFMHLIPEK
jgi:hypothetical protein